MFLQTMSHFPEKDKFDFSKVGVAHYTVVLSVTLSKFHSFSQLKQLLPSPKKQVLMREQY